MIKLPDAQLSHIGLFVNDMPLMKAFYTRMLGLIVSDEGLHTGRELVFLTRNADEHHQLVLARVEGRSVNGVPSLNQLSFRLKSLEDLRAYYAFYEKEGLKGLEGRDHGNSWSLYVFDPEGNKIELYVPTPWHVSQPWRAPLDLTMSADAIVAQTEARLKGEPSSKPAAERAAELARRLA
jgi:catechol 2,3-dioxygenase